MRERSGGGIRWIEGGLLSRAGALAAWTLRTGGASAASYASLNLGLHVGDEDRRVLENRARAARALGLDAADVAYAEQVHGGAVAVASAAERGRGARSHADAVRGADALVTVEAGLPIAVLSADCLLLALAAPGGAVAAVHASWRSTAALLVERAARALCEAAGARAGDLVAGLGPHLGACCYEVREDMRDAFLAARGPEASRFFEAREGRLYFHLERAVRAQLDSAGLARENVESAGACTACRAGDFFSHRRDRGRTGRMALLAVRRAL